MTRHDPMRGSRIVEAIDRFTFTLGYPPTVREIGGMVGLTSPAAVQYHLDRLRKDGVISWDRQKARSVRVLTDETCPTCHRPLVVA